MNSETVVSRDSSAREETHILLRSYSQIEIGKGRFDKKLFYSLKTAISFLPKLLQVFPSVVLLIYQTSEEKRLAVDPLFVFRVNSEIMLFI